MALGGTDGISLDELSADAVAFTDTNSVYKPAITDVQKALDELRFTRVSKLTMTATSASTLSLTIDNTTFHSCTGSTSGFSYQLPDATTLSVGREFEIYNEASVSVGIKNGSGTTLFTLNPNDLARLVLTSDGSVAGVWIQTVISASATGILSYSVGSDTLFSTSSTTDVVITGMTVTPVSGRYQCLYSSDIIITSNNRISQVVFYADGVAVERSRRRAQGTGSNYRASHNMVSEITVNGSQAIDVRVNIDSGSVDINQRRMILARLGS